jgi:hypothetical protein
MANLIGNAVILVAGGFLLAGGAIAVGVLLLYAFGVVLAKRLRAAINPDRTPRLTAG